MRRQYSNLNIIDNNLMPTVEQVLNVSPPQMRQKKIGNYLIEKTLGQGTFGKVKLATHIPTGEKVAIKILVKDKIVDVADVERVSREIHILKLIRHPNIIQLYEIIESPKHLFLVMEYMCQGELFDYIVSVGRMDEPEACHIFEQIISGIDHTHKLRIVHRDLKPENLLMDYDHTIRIVDFGLSNTYKPEERLRTACGSPCYAAPEMIESKNPYEPIMVDVWSAGVILYVMVNGCLPFEDDDTPKLYKKILNGEYSLSQNLSADLRDFIQRILTVDPEKRIRISEMKEHPWWNKHSRGYYPEGLVVGYHKIPIDQCALKELSKYNYDIELAEKSLEANRHNNLTTTYYLILKKFLREGGISKADFSAKEFDKKAIEPNERRQKNSLKPADLIKMVISPVNRANPHKSYYLGRERDKEDLRIEQKRQSQSKGKNGKMARRDKSFSKDNMASFYDSRPSKSNKNTLNRSITRPTRSPKRKQPKEHSILEQPRMRSISQSRANSKQAHRNKKSHQGSYMIGADTGADWPLEPKWKGEPAGGKLRNALRRR